MPRHNRATLGRMAADEFAQLDATAQADLVRRKKVLARELVAAAIARIERLNPMLNAVVTPLFAAALQAADEARTGPFAGVPFLLKDLLATLGGVRQTAGCRFLKDFVPTHDSELTRRFKRAGLIILGKTNCPELGILPTTEPQLFGPTRNPWDLSRSTGGSSGGSAAAVAAGLVPMAHANDGGGSIRIPASCCGLFGLKPTRARVPLGADLGDIMGGLVVEHALTRSVRDSATLLDAIAGPMPGDPYGVPPPARPYREEVARPPGQLRIAFTVAPDETGQAHGECQQAVREVAKLCAELGHQVGEAAPNLDREAFRQDFLVVWTSGTAWSIEQAARAMGRAPERAELEPLTWMLHEAGRQHSAAEYLRAWENLQRQARRIAAFFESYDLWLTPTVAEPPPPLGSFDAPEDFPLAALLRAAEFVPFTPIANVTGQPAMSVPLVWTEAGLPIGTQFVARHGDEATLFRLGAQLEAVRPWAQRWPALTDQSTEIGDRQGGRRKGAAS